MFDPPVPPASRGRVPGDRHCREVPASAVARIAARPGRLRRRPPCRLLPFAPASVRRSNGCRRRLPHRHDRRGPADRARAARLAAGRAGRARDRPVSVLPAGVPARAISVPVLLLLDGKEVRVGQTVDHVVARAGQGRGGRPPARRPRRARRAAHAVLRAQRHRFVLVFEPFERNGTMRVAGSTCSRMRRYVPHVCTLLRSAPGVSLSPLTSTSRSGPLSGRSSVL